MNKRGIVVAWVLGVAWLASTAHAAVEIAEGWTRETPPGTTVGVGYFTLKNTGSSRRELLKVTSPVASAISIHQTSIDANGVSRMWPVGKLELAPGEVLKFEPIGRHLMLEGLSAPLRAGTRVPVTLVFGNETPVTVQLEVRPLVAPAQSAGQEGHDAHAHHDHH